MWYVFHILGLKVPNVPLMETVCGLFWTSKTSLLCSRKSDQPLQRRVFHAARKQLSTASKQDACCNRTKPTKPSKPRQGCFRPIVALPWRKVRTLTFSNLLQAARQRLQIPGLVLHGTGELSMKYYAIQSQQMPTNANSISFSCQTGISLSFQHLSLLSSISLVHGLSSV